MMASRSRCGIRNANPRYKPPAQMAHDDITAMDRVLRTAGDMYGSVFISTVALAGRLALTCLRPPRCRKEDKTDRECQPCRPYAACHRSLTRAGTRGARRETGNTRSVDTTAGRHFPRGTSDHHRDSSTPGFATLAGSCLSLQVTPGRGAHRNSGSGLHPRTHW